ncbi:hypothetical protein [Micromonospora sp. CPCC 206061]|uniref:hypothetical protein n=1 Tax=Micromonospora sp. CPCC 206061 TaxID=3122410 RepID=UPI002FF28E00
MSDAAKESVRVATDAVNLAYEIHRQAVEAWHTAIKTGDPAVAEVTNAGVDRASRGITEALRMLDIAHAAGQGATQTLKAQMIRLLMLQAEAGAEQRAGATGELMQAANSQAASLKWATWALAGATVALVLATVFLIFVTANA